MKSGMNHGCFILAVAVCTACGQHKREERPWDRPHQPRQILVQFPPTISDAEISQRLASFPVQEVHRFGLSGRTVQLEVSADAADGDRLDRLADELQAEAGAKHVQPNYLYSLYEIPSGLPNDPEFSRQFGLHNDGSQGGDPGADMGMAKAWQLSQGSKDILIGVLDTGIDAQHPDLQDNIWHNPGESGLDENGQDRRSNGIDDDQNGYVDDWRGWDFIDNDNDPNDEIGHGTHVAGIIAAQGNNGIGITGVNWQASLVPGKIFKRGVQTDEATIVRGIEYFTRIGVKVSNNSWGGNSTSPLMEEAVRQTEAAGILFIAAAGNGTVNVDLEPDYPGAYDFKNIVVVAATDRQDQLGNFSNFGVKTVDVAAPGVDIYSTLPNGQYGSRSGTSMAAPFATGMAALLMGIYPHETPTQIKDRMVWGSRPVAGLQGVVKSAGVLDFRRALGDDGGQPGAVTLQRVTTRDHRNIQVQWLKAGDDGDHGESYRYDIRLSRSPILTEQDWEASLMPQCGEWQRTDDGTYAVVIQDLDINQSGYITLRAVDDRGQRGPLSISQPFAVTPISVIYRNDGGQAEGVVLDAPWGMEQDELGPYFTDNPRDRVIGYAESSMTLPPVPITNQGNLVLSFRHFLAIHERFDFAYVDVRVDGGDWQKVEDYTGYTFTNIYEELDLSSYLQEGRMMQVRFRIKTDRSFLYEGWRIRAINIIPKSSISKS